MDTARLAEMMRATLSEDKTERDAAEEQLKQVKQHTHTMCFRWKCKNLFTGFSYLNRQNCFRSVHYKNKHRRNVHLSGYVFFIYLFDFHFFFSLWVCVSALGIECVWMNFNTQAETIFVERAACVIAKNDVQLLPSDNLKIHFNCVYSEQCPHINSMIR